METVTHEPIVRRDCTPSAEASAREASARRGRATRYLGTKPELVPVADELDPRQLKDEIGDPLASHHEPFRPYAESEMLGELVSDPVASAAPAGEEVQQAIAAARAHARRQLEEEST